MKTAGDVSLRVRRYEPADHGRVRALHDAAMRGAGIHLGDGAWYDDLEEIEAVYLRDGGEFLVGTLDGRIAALGAVKKTTARRAEIKYMRVDPDLQGRGLGREMLAALERRAAELGYATLHLDTAVRQEGARRLYEKNGYREVARDAKGRLECVFYEKSLLA